MYKISSGLYASMTKYFTGLVFVVRELIAALQAVVKETFPLL
jgi:hypothetical protein